MSFDWFIVLSVSFLIGYSDDYCGFGFTTLNENHSNTRPHFAHCLHFSSRNICARILMLFPVVKAIFYEGVQRDIRSRIRIFIIWLNIVDREEWL